MNSRRLMVALKPRTTSYYIVGWTLCITANWPARLPTWVKTRLVVWSATSPLIPQDQTLDGADRTSHSGQYATSRHYSKQGNWRSVCVELSPEHADIP
jgi:hypothetical protein